MSQHGDPDIPVVVELSGEFSFLTDPAGKFSQQFPERVRRGLAAVLQQSGIPGKPRVEVKSSPDIPLTRLFLHGSLQPYSRELVQRLYQYFSTAGLTAKPLTLSWAKEIKDALPEEDVAKVIQQLIVEAAKQRPEVLLGPQQADAYIRIGERLVSQDLTRWEVPITKILKHLLKLRLSVANIRVVIKSIVDGLARGQQEDDIAESLVPQLRATTVEIEMNAGYLRQLVDVDLANGQSVSVYDSQVGDRVSEQFRMMANGLFYELGIRVPDISFVASANVKDHGFSIKLNPAGGIPRLGLKPEQLLVNATVDQLKTSIENSGLVASIIHRFRIKTEDAPESDDQGGITALRTTNPDNDTECSIINKTDKLALEKFYTWDPLGYLILSLTKELRRHAWCLLHHEAVEYELAQIHKDSPELVLATLENISLSRLTQILRELLRDEVTIRDLRSILERILTYDFIVTDPSKFIIVDDRLALSEQPPDDSRGDPHYYTQHVRAGLKRYLSHKLTRGRNTLFVYLLDEKIETQILDHLAAKRGSKGKDALTTTQFESIVGAIREELNSLSPAVALPVILTISEIRAFVRQMVVAEFPNLFVASYDELSPDSTIHPIARITL